MSDIMRVKWNDIIRRKCDLCDRRRTLMRVTGKGYWCTACIKRVVKKDRPRPRG